MDRTQGRERPPDRDRVRALNRDRDDTRPARPAERPYGPPDKDSRLPPCAPRAPPSHSDVAISPSDDSTDEEEGRRRDRKNRKAKHKEKKSHHKPHKEKSSRSKHKKSKDEKKRKHRSKYSSDDDTSDSETSSDYRKKRRLLKAAKKLPKQHKSNTKIIPMEPAPAGLKVDNILEEDYFAKSIEFAMWLKEAKGLFFSNLSSEETHKLFGTFVEIWNAGKLSAKYYQGIKAAPRTTHKWGIKLDSNESALLGKDVDDIINETLQKLEKRKFSKDQELLMDELLPKSTGREALIEKKALRREQARAREDSPEIFRERDVMGGGDDFQHRVVRERAWREKKAAAKSKDYMEKKSAFEEREAAAMSQFKAMVNMSGGKMVIPKRNDIS